jgi:hypothetical protein
MKSYEVLRRAFDPKGCKQAAAELNLSLSLIHQWSRGQAGQSAARNPLDVLLRILQTTGDARVLEWLCEQAGGEFVHGEKLRGLACAECQQLIAKLETLMKQGDGRWQMGVGGKQTGNIRGCRYRRANGRCGLHRARS